MSPFRMLRPDSGSLAHHPCKDCVHSLVSSFGTLTSTTCVLTDPTRIMKIVSSPSRMYTSLRGIIRRQARTVVVMLADCSSSSSAFIRSNASRAIKHSLRDQLASKSSESICWYKAKTRDRRSGVRVLWHRWMPSFLKSLLKDGYPWWPKNQSPPGLLALAEILALSLDQISFSIRISTFSSSKDVKPQKLHC